MSLEKSSSTAGIHRTHVAIVGAGPAGLVLGALLWRSGIDSVILERRSRADVESTIRAGVLEQSTVNLLDEIGTSKRLFEHGHIQYHVNFQFDGERIKLPLFEMTEGKAFFVYGQQHVLQDLIKNRIESRQRLWFNVDQVQIERHDRIDNDHGPLILFRRQDSPIMEELHCDFIAGCDGAPSSCARRSIPKDALETTERTYPFAWLSILAAVLLNTLELIYAQHSQHGFALQSFRSATESRFHLQVSCHDELKDWPDERIWKELELRLTPENVHWTLAKGPILEKSIFPLRTSMTLPMQYKRLFLAGDAAHIMPPTGAKGLNVAVKDAQVLAAALIDFYENNRCDKLNNYTVACLAHIQPAQKFAHDMTLIFHKFDTIETDRSEHHAYHAQRESLKNSYALQKSIAQMYVMSSVE